MATSSKSKARPARAAAKRSTAKRATKRATPRAPSRPAGRTAGAVGRDAISVLKDDHHTVKSLLASLKSARGERRLALFERVEAELTRHTELEEQIFYPAFRNAAQTKKDRQMFHEATEEHHAVDVVMPEVRNAAADDDIFAARLKVLTELVRHHIEEEEEEMFPRARKLLSRPELDELGARLATARRAARGSGTVSPLRAVASLVGLAR